MPDSEWRLLAEQLPPLTDHEALVEANRCLYCYDAPCTHACPTHIDIPRFIKKISTANITAEPALSSNSNLIRATCARVCPVEELCEGACVLNAEHKPIRIGRLQRFSMDYVYDRRIDVFQPAAPTGFRVTVIGAGPAGLSCAGELARRGYDVTVFDKRELGGGLSTYGIIVLREPVPVALAEVEMIARLGVRFVTGTEFPLLSPALMPSSSQPDLGNLRRWEYQAKSGLPMASHSLSRASWIQRIFTSATTLLSSAPAIRQSIVPLLPNAAEPAG